MPLRDIDGIKPPRTPCVWSCFTFFIYQIMFKKVIFGWSLLAQSLFPVLLVAQNEVQLPDSLKLVQLQSVEVTSSMATANSPFTFTNLGQDAIRKNDFGLDVPYLLSQTPSVVNTSDGGTGIGYTGIRIRGSDASRINVTIDGVPLNDAESQQVYWVDLPDLVGSASMIQVQRGVGTSTNGAGAFGGTVNVQTNPLSMKKYLGFNSSIGSFGTLKYGVNFGSGLLSNHFVVEGRLSKINSDGYIQRASANLGSAYLSALYLSDKSSLRFRVMRGTETTYQAWGGVPAQYIGIDSLRNYNVQGTEKPNTPYSNEVDSYVQTHAVLAGNHLFNDHWKANISLFYTKGKGYYEEYKAAKVLTNYGFLSPDTSDLVRRLWLDNDYYGAIYTLDYKTKGLEMTLGGGFNTYFGKHYGEVIKVIDYPNLASISPYYYYNEGKKSDLNVYLKTTALIAKGLNGYLDLQVRSISHNIIGRLDDGFRSFSDQINHTFFNPKIGLNYELGKHSLFYASTSVANKEPSRDDFVNADSNRIPNAERLVDSEVGYKYKSKKGSFGANVYYMNYKDQLVLSGKIDQVGAPIRVNVPQSYRMGLELEGAYLLNDSWSLSANMTLSENKILNFTEYIDNWDTQLQETFNRGKTDIAFSPSVISAAGVEYKAINNKTAQLSFALSNKYVGHQHIDNSGSEETVLNSYNQLDLKVFSSFKAWGLKNLKIKLAVNNLLNSKYSSNAWTYRYLSPTYNAVPDNAYTSKEEAKNQYNQTGYFPQAGRNILLSLNLDF
jgi:iron complex outermembrane recepter protein